MRNSGIWLLFVVVLAVSEVSAGQVRNVVFILADDLGWADTTLYGKTTLYQTPNLERLASRGMTFTNAYASPICSPTRASIMTGQNPARIGLTAPVAHLETERFTAEVASEGPPNQKCTNVRSATRIDPALPTLAGILSDHGYATAHFGKWHLGREPHSPLEKGFDSDVPHWWGPGPKSGYLAPWGYLDFKEGGPGEHIEDRMARAAVDWLTRRDPSRPFFLNYWQFSVHAPFGAKPQLINRYRSRISRDGKQRSPTYAAMVHSLDDAVGSLIDALDAEGIADETAIVFYSDNGGNIHCGLEESDSSGQSYVTAITSNHPLRGGKGGIHEGGIRVPAIVVWPGLTKPGSVSEARIQSTDLYPTILRLLDVDRPQAYPVDGVDFSNALRGEKFDRGPMFTYLPVHGNTPQWLPPSMAVHVDDWKLIRTFHYGQDGSHQYRLYNLRDDIGESSNLASKYPDVVHRLDAEIERFLGAAEVVVPLPNPRFDPARFDPARIGVQAGGLKMPPKQKDRAEKEPAAVRKDPLLLGWVARSARVSVSDEVLRVVPAGRQPFLANAKIRMTGPVEIRIRMRTGAKSVCQMQWRNADQSSFPGNGQRVSVKVTGEDWVEISGKLPVKGTLQHLRLMLPDGKQAVEIDWIELQSEVDGQQQLVRWDFTDQTAEQSE